MATQLMTAATDHSRRRLLTRMSRGAGGLAAGSVLGNGFGGAAWADAALDVQILQTASSLEVLAVSTYAAALGQGPEGPEAPAARALAAVGTPRAGATITAFVGDSLRRHSAHRRAFQTQTAALGGRVQDAPHPRFLALVSGADLSTAGKLVDLAATLEKITVDSYLVNLSVLQDHRSKELVAGVMAVGAQHLATLRALSSLLTGGVPQFVAVPFPLADMLALPTGVGSVATPDAFHKVSGQELIAEPASGAVR